VEDVEVRRVLLQPLEVALLGVAEEARVEEVDRHPAIVQDRERVEVREVGKVVELVRAAGEAFGAPVRHGGRLEKRDLRLRSRGLRGCGHE